ncbi:MAG: 16S rRNA (adenine(1518)-N(6)/adenine(1519)-N(6))-dimethyltransferase RsmA [Clostridia bacterium]
MKIDELKHFLSEHALQPNRALGQNFLTDASTIESILNAAMPDNKRVLEIGPGLGALTSALCKRAHYVVAVEKDATMAELLRTLLPAENLTVVTQDFLETNVPALMGEGSYLAIGNLPYYVTTPIVEKLLLLLPDSMTLMVQTEAAARFFARPGDRVYGPVAVLSQYYYTPTQVLDVPNTCFYPAPDVTSTVVHLSRTEPRELQPAVFFRFLRRIFAMRRKTLRNNLARPSGFDAALESLGLPAGVRAEAIDPALLSALCLLFVSSGKEGKEQLADPKFAEEVNPS